MQTRRAKMFERFMFWLVVIIAIGFMIFMIWIMCGIAKRADRFCTMQEPEEDKWGMQIDPWEQTVNKQDRDAGPGP